MVKVSREMADLLARYVHMKMTTGSNFYFEFSFFH